MKFMSIHKIRTLEIRRFTVACSYFISRTNVLTRMCSLFCSRFIELYIGPDAVVNAPVYLLQLPTVKTVVFFTQPRKHMHVNLSYKYILWCE